MFKERLLFEKNAVSIKQLRRAARKRIYNSSRRASTKLPKGFFKSNLDKAETNISRHTSNIKKLNKKLEGLGIDLEGANRSVEELSNVDIEGHRKNLKSSASNVRKWITDAKEEALAENDLKNWRDYLPRKVNRLQKDRRAINKVRQGKAQNIKYMKRLNKDIDQAQNELAAEKKLLRISKDGWGQADFDQGHSGKVRIHGFKNKTPQERAVIALHEGREMIEEDRYKKLGVKSFGTDAMGIKDSGHSNVTVPLYDANIYRTLTDDDALASKLKKMREPEIQAAKKLLPKGAPIFDQVLGSGITYGKRSKPKSIIRAENILSGKVSASDAAKSHASKMVSNYTKRNAPNTRLNRREINVIRKLNDQKFNPTIFKKASFNPLWPTLLARKLN